MRFVRILWAATGCLALIGSPQVWGAPTNWPTFRGAARTAVAPDQGLIKEWPAEGPPQVWTAEGAGRGYASLAIAEGRIYTLGDKCSGAPDEDEYLTCFDVETGKLVWRAKTGAPWLEGPEDWQSSRSTPTVDGDRVYIITAHGKLLCFSTEGKELWQKDLKADFKGDKADGWGYSESVLIDGDKLVCIPGKSDHTMVALNKMNGELLWSTSRADDRGAGHASIVIAEVGGTKVYVTVTGSGPMGVRAKDGELLWTYDIEQTTAVIPTPIIKGDYVFFAVGYKRGAALLQQVPAAGGKVEVKEIYPLQTELANKHGGVVLIGDHIYGDSDDKGTPYCAEMMTGKVVWKKRGSGKDSACVAAADGHLYIRYADGTMTLVKADPAGMEEVSSFKIPDSGERPSWSHPVIVDGKLYLREGDKIICFSLKP